MAGLEDQIKKYWEDQYKKQKAGSTINNLSDKIKRVFNPLMPNRRTNAPELDPNFEWGQAEDWIPTPMGTAGGISFNQGGMTTRSPIVTSTTNVRNVTRAPRRQASSPGSVGRIPFSPNLANDARFMNPSINVDEINARFRQQQEEANFDPAADIMGQIESILNQQHGSPDRWVSPYSQADLDRIGAGLMDAANNAKGQFDASQADIAAIYDEAINRRADIQAGLAEQLASNLSNIGVSAQGPAEADAVAAQQFLNETANQNRAADQSFNEKLGTLSQTLGAQLANAARAGLLTPKQFVRGNEGQMSDADKFRLGMLQDQLAGINGGNSDIESIVTENFSNENPLVPQMIASIEDPELREEATRLYDLKGTPEGVLAELAERMQQPAPLSGNLNFMGRNLVSPLYGAINQNRRGMFDEQAQMNQMLIDLFRQISPTWQGVPTERTIRQTSRS